MTTIEEDIVPTLDEYVSAVLEEVMSGEGWDAEDWEQHGKGLRDRLRPLIRFMAQDFHDRGYAKALGEGKK